MCRICWSNCSTSTKCNAKWKFWTLWWIQQQIPISVSAPHRWLNSVAVQMATRAYRARIARTDSFVNRPVPGWVVVWQLKNHAEQELTAIQAAASLANRAHVHWPILVTISHAPATWDQTTTSYATANAATKGDDAKNAKMVSSATQCNRAVLVHVVQLRQFQTVTPVVHYAFSKTVDANANNSSLERVATSALANHSCWIHERWPVASTVSAAAWQKSAAAAHCIVIQCVPHSHPIAMNSQPSPTTKIRPKLSNRCRPSTMKSPSAAPQATQTFTFGVCHRDSLVTKSHRTAAISTTQSATCQHQVALCRATTLQTLSFAAWTISQSCIIAAMKCRRAVCSHTLCQLSKTNGNASTAIASIVSICWWH